MRGVATPKPGIGDSLKCSFCGKARNQVIKLIAGPGVYICDECIDLCTEIIEEEIGERPKGVLDSEIEAAARAATDAVHRLRLLAQQAQARSDDDDPQ